MRVRLAVEVLETRFTPAIDLRIMTYNVAAASGPIRGGLSDILHAVGLQSLNGVARPVDILAVQETNSNSSNTGATAAVQQVLNSLYGAGSYARGTVNGQGSGGTQGIVYRTSTVQLISEVAVGTVSSTGAARQALRHRVRPIGGGSDIYIYNVHFKANDSNPDDDDDRRLVEANTIRLNADALPADAQVLYVGDFNFYGSGASEPAYTRVLQPGNGQAVDVANPAGNWFRNSNTHRQLYTQAPLNNPGPGLTGGGMDDRFDYIFMSIELTDGFGLDYRAGSYRVFGNNGSLNVNVDITNTNNTALVNTGLSFAQQQTVLSRLGAFTDHLPVLADFVIPTVRFTTSTLAASEAAGTVFVTVTRSPAVGPLTVNTLFSGTATPGLDYLAPAGPLVFAAGESTQTIPLQLIDNDTNQPHRTVVVSLADPSGGVVLATPAVTTLTILDDDALQVAATTVNTGAAQRSRVTSYMVHFNGIVTVDATSFALAGFPGVLTANAVTTTGRTTVTLTFSGAGTEFTSLADGRYTLTIPGVSGLTGPSSFDFLRLFGDVTGNGVVNAADTALMRISVGSTVGSAAYRAELDFDGNGVVNAADLSRFRTRIGVILP